MGLDHARRWTSKRDNQAISLIGRRKFMDAARPRSGPASSVVAATIRAADRKLAERKFSLKKRKKGSGLQLEATPLAPDA